MSWLNSPTSWLYELLRLSKSNKEALREALADSEVFIAQISIVREKEDDRHCHHTSKQFSYIIFTPNDMQIKIKYDRPLYYAGYIRSSEMSRIQFDPGSALRIMPRRVMQHLGIPTHRLGATQTAIYGFNTNGAHQMGNIILSC